MDRIQARFRLQQISREREKKILEFLIDKESNFAVKQHHLAQLEKAKFEIARIDYLMSSLEDDVLLYYGDISNSESDFSSDSLF
ncbi:unnamed protein product [Blepharisma stoltei]|uniref:Uncharacterized protein n=1 Tax=Blepharisma stoltei TaxID=1481888 RepID=A0AAU9IRV4_9CILI|nr:unnamed protein product [Blepharisma stoltei]